MLMVYMIISEMPFLFNLVDCTSSGLALERQSYQIYSTKSSDIILSYKFEEEKSASKI